MSQKGRLASDAVLGLAKTCAKIRVSFFDYFGNELGIPGPEIPPLASLVNPAPS